jgi:hypothetical protein
MGKNFFMGMLYYTRWSNVRCVNLQKAGCVLYSKKANCHMDDSSYQAPFIEGRRRRSPKRRMIISIIVVFLLVLIGIGSIQFLSTTLTGGVTPTPTPEPTPIVFPTDAPTVTPTTTVKVSVTP